MRANEPKEKEKIPKKIEKDKKGYLYYLKKSEYSISLKRQGKRDFASR